MLWSKDFNVSDLVFDNVDCILWPPRSEIDFSEDMKERLRKPIGELVTGRDPDEVTFTLKKLIEEANPPLVVAVGDYVSSKLRQHDVRVDIFVIDGKIERVEKPADLLHIKGVHIVEAVNEAGTISPSSAEKLHELMHSFEVWPAILKIDGEEDLIGLAAILSAPDNTVIVYGQPKKGAVLVRVSEAIREEMVEIIHGA